MFRFSGLKGGNATTLAMCVIVCCWDAQWNRLERHAVGGLDPYRCCAAAGFSVGA